MHASDISIVINYNNNLIRYETEINGTLKSAVERLAINNLRVNLEKTNCIQFAARGHREIYVNINYDRKIEQKKH